MSKPSTYRGDTSRNPDSLDTFPKVWLTQQHMADLFQTSKQNVGQHLKNIFEEDELAENSVVKNFFTTATDGKDDRTNCYNLDAIISVGYRVKSAVATRFRIWATQQLREFIVKGFVLDDSLFNVNTVDDTNCEGRSPKCEVESVRHSKFAIQQSGRVWIQLFHSALNEKGRAGFVMANAVSDARASEQELRN